MNISAWRKVAAVGLGTALLAAGCVVSSGDGETGTGGTSGTSGSGGSTAGKGGSGGSTGGTTGGTAGTGGSTGGTGGSTGGTAGTGGADSGPPNVCVTCMQTNCGAEYTACTGTCSTELVCIQDCVLGAVAEGGVADTTTIGTCSNQCASGGSISSETNDAISCMSVGQRADGGASSAGCLSECLSG